MPQAQTEREIENEMADFLWEQVMADEAGTLPAEHRAMLDKAAPGWTDPAYRERERAYRARAQRREQAKRCRIRR